MNRNEFLEGLFSTTDGEHNPNKELARLFTTTLCWASGAHGNHTIKENVHIPHHRRNEMFRGIKVDLEDGYTTIISCFGHPGQMLHLQFTHTLQPEEAPDFYTEYILEHGEYGVTIQYRDYNRPEWYQASVTEKIVRDLGVIIEGIQYKLTEQAR